jgi:hypothetical protein
MTGKQMLEVVDKLDEHVSGFASKIEHLLKVVDMQQSIIDKQKEIITLLEAK